MKPRSFLPGHAITGNSISDFDRARRLALAGMAAAGLALMRQPAHAGPLLDRLRERRAARGGETGGAAEAAGAPAGSMPPGARTLANQHYGPGPAQVFDVYLPAEAREAPVIFMVHGGAWAVGDKAMGRVVDAKVARWVQRGFVFVSINYRMLPEAAPDVQLRDVARALSVAQEQAPRWGADPHRFILMGHSAGAHLATLLAVSPPGGPEAQRFLPVLGTVALDSAAMDVVSLMSERHLRLYDRPFGTDPAYWRAMSPTLMMHSGAAPVLAVCSTRREDSCAQAKQFVAQATRLGVRAASLGEDLSHAEINGQLGQEGAYTRAVEDFMASLDESVARRLARAS